MCARHQTGRAAGCMLIAEASPALDDLARLEREAKAVLFSVWWAGGSLAHNPV